MVESYLTDPEFLPIRQAYVDELRKKAPEMLVAVKNKNLDLVQSFGHNLKGNGTSYGFQRISDLGCEIEAAAIAGDESILLDRLPLLIDFLADLTL